MVNAATAFRAFLSLLPIAVPVLVAGAVLRGAEYDEQYTLFLTGQVVRPDWGDAIFPASAVAALQTPAFDPVGLAHALRTTDVHPPLYFWLVAAWRMLAGGDLLAARSLSVICALGSLLMVVLLACRHGVRPLPAMALTLGCYGFVYTGGIARGFALAILLTLAGAVLLGRPRPLAAGLALGAACCANYLAVFAAAGYLVGRAAVLPRPVAVLTRVGIGMAPFLALDLWFFLAQRGSRPDQFPPFDLLGSLPRLLRYMVANVLGGLPLYFPPPWGAVVAVVLTILAVGLAVVMLPMVRRHPALLGAAMAPPLGLLALGLVFDNTPIELRYLSFSIPFVAILLAGALDRFPPWALATLLLIQAASLTGLMLGRETRQPAQEAARAAAILATGGVVLIPFGNDGVGIPGAFGIEAPPALRLLVVRASDDPDDLRARIADERRVVIAALAQDDASRAAIPVMRAATQGTCWRRAVQGFNVTAFDRLC